MILSQLRQLISDIFFSYASSLCFLCRCSFKTLLASTKERRETVCMKKSFLSTTRKNVYYRLVNVSIDAFFDLPFSIIFPHSICTRIISGWWVEDKKIYRKRKDGSRVETWTHVETNKSPFYLLVQSKPENIENIDGKKIQEEWEDCKKGENRIPHLKSKSTSNPRW